MSTTTARQRSTPNNARTAENAVVGLESKLHALQEYNDTDGHFSLVRNFRLADLVTIMNGFCGAYSIFSSARYLLTSDKRHLWLAHAFPLAGLMFDFLDGKVARWRKSSSMLGQELDSLADLISFGVAPSLLAFTVGLRTPLDVFILTCFICCGLARLARFNATAAILPKDGKGKARYFEGLPIPSSLVLVGLLSYWTRNGWIEGDPSGVAFGEGIPGGVIDIGALLRLKDSTAPMSVDDSWVVHKVSFIFAMWAAAMVSKTLRVPKL
ncbi:CDP-diacylglycerol-serine O-phosphatidyltransferase [Tulasnella sp. 419]|nr:CDP-diacylglycerol-serine O-phosphatidyltransferase [Tulasnella sp. 418]KAG8967934.1 CDP-diacylglycerol-serine O-phosphatidyltransferase [Tulasnella sp. 419]